LVLKTKYLDVKNLIIISLCCLFQACVQHGDRTKRKYILENGTERNVKIDFYEKSNHKGSNSRSGKGIIAEGLSDDLGMDRSLFPAFFGSSDSIVVVYDNKKIQIYYLKGSLPHTSKHLLDNSSYVIESNELYRYTFTEEDYKRANDL
jgi:hypothetical protein